MLKQTSGPVLYYFVSRKNARNPVVDHLQDACQNGRGKSKSSWLLRDLGTNVYF